MKLKTNVFIHKIYYFIAFLLANSFLWIFLAHIINDPVDKEIFNMFIGSYNCQASELKEKIMSSEDFPTNIRRFYVKHYSLTSETFSTNLKTHGLVHSDILILPLSQLDKLPSYASLCASFDNETATKIFGNTVSYLSNDNINYGIKIYDSINQQGYLSDYITYTINDYVEEDYYLVFKKGSIHLGDLSNKTKTDYAIKIVKDIIFHV